PARNNLGLSLTLSGHYEQAVAELSKLALDPAATPRMRHNLALALGLKGDEAAAAKIAHADLDENTIGENQRFHAAIRRAGGLGRADRRCLPAGPQIRAWAEPHFGRTAVLRRPRTRSADRIFLRGGRQRARTAER